MIELAAIVWKTSTAAALGRLQADGSAAADNDGRYAELLQRRAAGRRFWEAAAAHFVSSDSPGVRDFRGWIGAPGMVGGADWALRCRECVGSGTDGAVTAALTDRSRRSVFSTRRGSDILLLPEWDLPGRLRGFLCVAGPQPRAEIIYLPAPEFRGVADAAGLFLLPVTFAPERPEWAGQLFVFDDPLLATRLQLRWLRDHPGPLPLLACRQDAPASRTPWEATRRTQIICWGAATATNIVAQARLSGGTVASRRATPAELDLNLRSWSPGQWLRSVQRTAESWDVALRRRLRTSDDATAAANLTAAGLAQHELRQFVDECDPQLRERLQRLQGPQVTIRRAAFGKKSICERDGCWYADDALIADAIVRIDQVLRTSDARTYYRGELHHRGAVVPFVERVEPLDKDLWGWARTKLRDAGVGIPMFDRAFARAAMNLSLQLHQPTFVQGADLIGWDAQQRQFNFCSFAIKDDGDVTDEVACLATAPAPSATLQPPEPLGGMTRLLSQDDAAVDVCWAVAACVAASILAPALRREPIGVVLDGHAARQGGGAVAMQLGCLQSQSLPQPTHRWPTLVVGNVAAAIEKQPLWLATDAPAWTLLSAESATACALGLQRQWVVIRDRRQTTGATLLDAGGLPRLLPAYLHDICRRRLDIDCSPGTLPESVLEDMAGWFDRTGGDADVVRRAALRIVWPKAAAAHFGELLRLLVHAGRFMSFRPDQQSKRRSDAVLVYLSETSRVLVPQQRFCREAERMAGTSPDVGRITSALRDAGVDAVETECDRVTWWSLPEAWLAAAIKEED